MQPSPRIAVVTGASRGLGRAIALKLAHSNYHVICGQRTLPPESHMASPASNIRVISLDLRCEQSIQTFAAILLDQLPHLDLLVNNAAICPKYPADPRLVDEHWRSVMQVNFTAHVLLTRQLHPLLLRSSKLPRVLNVSSGDGELLYFADDLRALLIGFSAGNNVDLVLEQVDGMLRKLIHDAKSKVNEHIFNGQPAYKFSKAALNTYTQVASRSNLTCVAKQPIRFVSVCPGDVDTAMADEGALTISPTEAVCKMWPLLDVGVPCPNGVFLRYNEVISW